MADQFEGTSPAEQTNLGFKMFGNSVNKFSAAVAGIDTMSQILNRQLKAAAKEQTITQTKDKSIAEQQNEAAQKQAEAADIHEELAKQAKNSAQKEATTTRAQLNMFQRGALNFNNAVKSFSINAKSALGGGLRSMFDGLMGQIKDLASTITQFAGRFFVVFTLVNILTRTLQRLVDLANAKRIGTRIFGSDTQSLDQLAERARQSSLIPISVSQSVQIAVGLNSELNNSTRLSGQLIANVAEVARGINGDATQAAKFFGRAIMATNASVEDVKQTFAISAKIAGDFGLTIDELGQEIANNVELAQQFNLATEQGRLLLARSAATARMLGSDMKAVRSFGDQFFDIDAAVEAAARGAAFGINISATQRMIQGATDPAGLLVNVLKQLQATIGTPSAEGFDRIILDRTLKSLPELSSVFSNVEDLNIALVKLNEGQISAVEQSIKQIQKDAIRARDFNREALMSFDKMVEQGNTIEQQLEDLADSIAEKLASFIKGPFMWVVDGIMEIVVWIQRLVRGLSAKFNFDIYAEEQKIRNDVSKAAASQLVGTIAEQLTQKTGIGADSIVDPGELTKAAAERAQQLRDRTGLEINTQAFMKEILDAIDRRSGLTRDGELKVRVVDINNRTIMSGAFDSKL
jgi:hypothetical protein